MGYDSERELDYVDVWLTNGSGSYGSRTNNRKHLGRFYDGEVNPEQTIVPETPADQLIGDICNIT
jgi:hypothetical protein